MGFPMAGHLVTRGGLDMTVYNRTPDKGRALDCQLHRGRSAATPQRGRADADVVFACVGNDDDLRAGDGRRRRCIPRHEARVRCSSTTPRPPPTWRANSMPRPRRRGIGFVDAPVSGGQAGAENGALTVMCGGDPEDYAKAEPLITHFSKMRKLLGPAGSGQLAKMCNQIAIAGLVQGLAEAVNFGMKAGLDMEAVVDVISKGAAGSWQMENRHKTMIARQVRFWLCRRLDAQGSRHLHRRSPPQWRAPAGDRPGRPVLRRSAETWRRPLGYVEPDCPVSETEHARACPGHPRTRAYGAAATAVTVLVESSTVTLILAPAASIAASMPSATIHDVPSSSIDASWWPDRRILLRHPFRRPRRRVASATVGGKCCCDTVHV